MIGDTYRIKYSDYVEFSAATALQLSQNNVLPVTAAPTAAPAAGTNPRYKLTQTGAVYQWNFALSKWEIVLDNGRCIKIEATDRLARPGINTTNFNSTFPNTPIDLIFYGHRAAGYGAQLWNNLFYLLENFAQPREALDVIRPKYSKNPVTGQIWVDTTNTPAVARWYGRDNTFYKLGASVNITPYANQVASDDFWFDNSPTVYAFKYQTFDISCIPYASTKEYNDFVDAITSLPGSPSIPKITTAGDKLTPAKWTVLLNALRTLAAANGINEPSATLLTVAGDNFTICNNSQYSAATIRTAFNELTDLINAITVKLFPPATLPLASFTTSHSIGGVPFTAILTNTSTISAINSRDVFGQTRFLWEIKNSVGTVIHTIGSLTTPVALGAPNPASGNQSYLFTAPDTYTVSLTIKNSTGQTSVRSSVTAVALPIANFRIGPDDSPDASLTAPFQLSFTDLTANNPTSWLWNFGDGNTSILRNPIHTYTRQGSFTVTLVATNFAGSSTATVAHAVKVGIAPGTNGVADFLYTTPNRLTAVTTPFTVSFTDITPGNPEQWLWNFGNGTTSTERNPVCTYATWGSFTVTLTASNALGSSTKTLVNLVNIGLAPTPSFTLSSGVGYLPVSVTATDTSSPVPTSWLWEFGDGSTATTRNATRAYTSYGTYTVRLTATNPVGSASTTRSLTVIAPAPVASFTFSPTSGQAPVAIQFTNTSTNTPTSWLWNFGNGATSTARNPNHTYTGGGNFTVTLTATNSSGQNTVSATTGYILPAAGSRVFTTGTHSFTVPSGITTLGVESAGGGGSGGSSWCCDTSCSGGGGGGGGGGGWCKGTIPVTPGAVLTVTVGGPGARAAGASWGGGAGAATIVSGSGIYIQVNGGGGGGGGGNTTTGGPGGAGGSVSTLTGFSGTYGPGANGAQANVVDYYEGMGPDYVYITGGCVNGLTGGSTVNAAGGTGGPNGGYGGGGGGGGASLGTGGNGGGGSPNFTPPTSGGYGGGGGGVGDEFSGSSNPTVGAAGVVIFTWSSANTQQSGQTYRAPTTTPPPYRAAEYVYPASDGGGGGN